MQLELHSLSHDMRITIEIFLRAARAGARILAVPRGTPSPRGESEEV